MWQNRSLFTTVQYNSKMKCDKIEVYLLHCSIQQQDEMWQNSKSLFIYHCSIQQQDEMWQNRSLFTTVQYNSKMKCDKIEVYLPLFNRTARWNVTK